MDAVIHTYFSREQVLRLERGLPRLDALSDRMLLPFQAQQLRFSAVLWINARWFLQRDIDINDDRTRKRVSDWLLAEFGYAVPRPEDPKGAFTEGKKTLHADRYGGSTGRSIHGGSGRVATA